MILLSIIALKDKVIEFTDIVHIANECVDLNNPECIRKLLCNFYNVEDNQLSLEDYSPFTKSFTFVWTDDNDIAQSCVYREVICYWNKLK